MFHLLVFLIILFGLGIFTFRHFTRGWLIIKSVVLLLLRLGLLLLPPQPGHFPLEHLLISVVHINITSTSHYHQISDLRPDRGVLSPRCPADN